MNALLLLASTFAVFFALGLQSQFVNNGHYFGAFVNSLAISAAQLVLLKLAPDASGLEIAAYLSGGPFGIVCSMVAFRYLRSRQEQTSIPLRPILLPRKVQASKPRPTDTRAPIAKKQATETSKLNQLLRERLNEIDANRNSKDIK